jgi:uncharacterized DUF497 family protein
MGGSVLEYALQLKHDIAGAITLVFFIRKTTREALIVSARDMTSSEGKRYEKS